VNREPNKASEEIEGAVAQKTPPKPPERWGLSSSAFYAAHRKRQVRVVFPDNKYLVGTLIGVDKFDLVLECENQTTRLVPKHAVRWIELYLERKEFR